MLIHGLEANLKGVQIIRHQFLCIQRMSTESLTKYIRGSNKKLKLESLVTIEFLVYEKTVPEEFTLFRKIFTPS